MSNPDLSLVQSLRIDPQPAEVSYRINQHLTPGFYRLYIVAPFDTKILVSPLNPAVGFEFQPDLDASPEIWNSLLSVPVEGQYVFMVRVNRAISEPLNVDFVRQGPSVPPAPQPPSPPPVQPPPPAAPPSNPDAVNQERYRRMGYTITGDGAVEFFYVATRRNVQTGEIQICLNVLWAWSPDVHDPVRTIGSLNASSSNNPPGWRYNRIGPSPTRAAAEQTALTLAMQIFGDPTRYGIFGRGGGPIPSADYRDPKFA
jgi:hypothetical protein